VLAVVYGFKALAADGVSWAGVAPAFAGLAVGAAFVARQRRLGDPMIDLALFRRPAFSAALGANTLAFAVLFGREILVAQQLQLVLGFSPLAAGLWSVPSAAAFVVGAQLTPALAARWRPAPVMLGGLLFSLLGIGALTQVATPGGPAVLVAGVTVMSLGLAPVFTLAADVARRRSVRGVRDELGAGRRGRHRAARHDRDGRVPWRGARVRHPRRRGGGGRAAPGAARAEVLAPAREAFTEGLQVAATVSGAIVFAAVAVILAGVVSRSAPDTSPAPQPG
jgi:DHA2 family multidrug resistance protein-like MFS transporter